MNKYKSILKKNIALKFLSSSLIYLPSPVNISIWWNFGSLLGLFLGVQMISGIFLSMHYVSNVNYSFFSVIHIIQDVNFGWLLRLVHMNGASFFFMLVYIHIGRGMYYGSYKLKKTWIMGVFILLLMMATAFLGYVLPWGQMSFWGATVITNLISVIPYFGTTLVEWVWGGFSVGNPTLNRFYTLHFFFPFILLAMVILHLAFLHETGSNNPLGVVSNYYKVIFHAYYTLKDLLGGVILLFFFMMIVLESPYLLGDPENFIMATSSVTPAHIQPEWYFLFAYTILRSIPNKLSGVLGLLMSILIMLIMPFMYNSKFQNLSFYSFSQIYYWFFFYMFFLLTWLGAKSVVYPFVGVSQVMTLMYFMYYFLNYFMMLMWDFFLE